MFILVITKKEEMKMYYVVKLFKVGHSYALVIPRGMMKRQQYLPGDRFLMISEGDDLRIAKADKIISKSFGPGGMARINAEEKRRCLAEETAKKGLKAEG